MVETSKVRIAIIIIIAKRDSFGEKNLHRALIVEWRAARGGLQLVVRV